LLEVIEGVDGPLTALAEPMGNGSGATPDGRLQAVCDGEVALLPERLAKLTLAELARGW
jgi:hypothetical protein